MEPVGSSEVEGYEMYVSMKERKGGTLGAGWLTGGEDEEDEDGAVKEIAHFDLRMLGTRREKTGLVRSVSMCA